MPARNGEGIELLADPTRCAIVAQIALGRGRPSRIAKEVGRSRKMHRDPADGRKRLSLIEPLKLGQLRR